MKRILMLLLITVTMLCACGVEEKELTTDINKEEFTFSLTPSDNYLLDVQSLNSHFLLQKSESTSFFSVLNNENEISIGIEKGKPYITYNNTIEWIDTEEDFDDEIYKLISDYKEFFESCFTVKSYDRKDDIIIVNTDLLGTDCTVVLDEKDGEVPSVYTEAVGGKLNIYSTAPRELNLDYDKEKVGDSSKLKDSIELSYNLLESLKSEIIL